MSEFKIGEAATFVAPKHECADGCYELSGQDCMVIGFWERSHVEVEFAGGRRVIALRSHLRKKRPPEETTTWQAVKSIAGWNPQGVPA